MSKQPEKHPRSIVTLSLCTGIIVGGISSYMFFAPAPEAPPVHKAHPMLQVDTSLPVPSVSVEVFEDKMGGYNVHLITKNFTFTPEDVNTAPVANEGHAHIFVNGVKVSRLYGPWYHLSANTLKEGDNEVVVTLNANDHGEWALGELHIQGRANITF